MIQTFQTSNSIVDIHYQQTGAATAVNPLGMREMQALAYEHRRKRFLLIKAPPASGKSRALMYIALDKLAHQGIKKVVVAVPETSSTDFRIVFNGDADKISSVTLSGMTISLMGQDARTA